MISFDEFNAVVEKLKRYNDAINNIDYCTAQYSDIFPDVCFPGSSLQDTIVRMLAVTVNPDRVDELYEFLSWWMWDLEFGKLFTVGDIIDIRFSSFVDLSTTENLYKYLKCIKGELL